MARPPTYVTTKQLRDVQKEIERMNRIITSLLQLLKPGKRRKGKV